MGETVLEGLGDLNWLFGWWNQAQQGWFVDDWSFGISNDIEDLTEMVIKVTMTESGIKGTVDGKVLFESGPEDHLVNTVTNFILGTRPEEEAGVTGSTNWMRLSAFEFDDSRPQARARPDFAKLTKLPIRKK